MKSIRRCQHIISFIIVMFIIGMIVLVLKIYRESSFYMMNSDQHELGFVYDRKGDVLFDGSGRNSYPDNYFVDVGNIIGDDSGQMDNTLVAQNISKLNNYSFSSGLTSSGKAAIYTTMDHAANRAVYDAFGYQEGCVVAYNYQNGDILVSTSLPSIDVTRGYDDIANFKPEIVTDDTSSYYPSQNIVENIVLDDKGKYKINAKLEQTINTLEELGQHDMAEKLRRDNSSHPRKYRSFHYLPYKTDSRFEQMFLEEVLMKDEIESLGLEVYYNGDRALTEFKIKCY